MGLWHWFARHGCCREVCESSAQQRRACGDLAWPPPAVLYPQPCSVRNWKTTFEPSPEPNTWRGAGQFQPTRAQVQLLEWFLPQTEGKAPAAGPAAGWGLAPSGGLWGEKAGRQGSASGECCPCSVRNGTSALPPSFGRAAAVTSKVPKLCLSLMPLWQAPFSWGHLRGSGHLLTLQVLALPCSTSSMDMAACPSSPLWNAKRVLSHPSWRRAVHRNCWKVLLGDPAPVTCGAEVSVPRGLSWVGRAGGPCWCWGRPGKPISFVTILGFGEKFHDVAVFLQSLMDLFRRSTAVGDNYTLVGRRYSKTKRRGKAKREKNHTLFNSFLSMWLVYLSALQTCKYDYRALLCGFKMLENTWFSFLFICA